MDKDTNKTSLQEDFLPKKILRKHFFRIIGITTCLLFSAIFYLHAENFRPQNANVTIQKNDVSLESVLNEIEHQTDYLFVYNKQVDVSQKVSVNFSNVYLQKVLDNIFPNLNIRYEIDGKYVVLSHGKETNSVKKEQDKKVVHGIVVDPNGVPIIGANILEKGTTNGVLTDAEGKFHIKTQEGSILQISFIGYVTAEINVNDKNTFSIVLQENTEFLDEVVVTALGVGKQKRSLSYSTEQVRMDGVNNIKNVNLGESLIGKIAGVNIASSSGATGVGGDPRIVIRGDRSISNNNQPLVVVDGVYYGTDAASLSSLNSDDIESMNILKGASAAALYGSAANNGVIVITTKKGKAGERNITFNSVSTFDTPYLYPEFQNEYAQGLNGEYMMNEESNSWGPRIEGQKVTSWTGEEISLEKQENNYKDIFSTGYNLSNSVSYSAGNDLVTGYFSYSNTTARGVLDNNTLQRNNFNLRLTSNVTKNLKADLRMVYNQQTLKNAPAQGYSMFSPMSQLLRMPRTIRVDDIENYVYYDDNYSRKQVTWAPGSTAVVNPYWAKYAREYSQKRNSLNTILSLRYDLTDYLYVQLRGSLYSSNRSNEELIYNDTPYVNFGKGGYNLSFYKTQRLVGDILVGFDKNLNKDFHLNMLIGAEINDRQDKNLVSSSGTDGLSVENQFGLSFGITPTTEDGESHIQKQGIYGTAQLSFRDMLYLDVTGRNDWSSTLPAPHSFFYPSIGLVGIISEMIELPSWISFCKLRASYAQVGNDAKYAIINQAFEANASGPIGMIKLSNNRSPQNLIPEKTKSWEFGGEVKFFQNRIGIDFTYYISNTYNQLLKIDAPPAVGFSAQYLNSGNIQNKGVELMLTVSPFKEKDFSWDVYAQFSMNKNIVKELSETMKKVTLTDAKDMIGLVQVREGEPFGQIYSRGFVKNEAGEIIVDDLGYPMVNSEPDSEYMGNMNYDWQSGLTNTFSYKNWNLSFLIDLNWGGIRMSSTESTLQLYGNGKNSLYGREGFVFKGVKQDGSINDITITAQNYAKVVAGRGSAGVGELFRHDATNSRLRELSLGYTFEFNKKYIKNCSISLVGRNLFFFYNGCKWFDPDMTANPDNNGRSGENSALPYSRTFGVNLKLTL